MPLAGCHADLPKEITRVVQKEDLGHDVASSPRTPLLAMSLTVILTMLPS